MFLHKFCYLQIALMYKSRWFQKEYQGICVLCFLLSTLKEQQSFLRMVRE